MQCVYRCPEHGQFAIEVDGKTGRSPRRHKCPSCPRRPRLERRLLGGFAGNLLPEIQPHFNLSFNCHVESRAHLEALQAKHGTVDFSPSNIRGPSTSWQ